MEHATIEPGDIVTLKTDHATEQFVVLPGYILRGHGSVESSLMVAAYDEIATVRRPAPLTVDFDPIPVNADGFDMGLADVKPVPEADPEPNVLKWVGSAVANSYQMSTCGRFMVVSANNKGFPFYGIDLYVRYATGSIARTGANGTLEEAVAWCQDRKRYAVVTRVDGSQHLEEVNIPF